MALACPTGKRQFPNVKAARAAHHHAHFRIRVYSCEMCGFYHTTNGEKRENRRRWAPVAVFLASMPCATMAEPLSRSPALEPLVWDGAPRPIGLTIVALEGDSGNQDAGSPGIGQSVEPAVELVLQAHADRILQLEAKLAQRKLFVDNFVGCVKSAFIWAGSDIVSTAGVKERCKDCGEQNEAAFSDLALIGLKFGQLGSQIAVCKSAAEGGTTATKIVTWTNRVIHGSAVLLNLISTITGKPVIRWKDSTGTAARRP